MKDLIEYISTLENESFEGWSDEAKAGYLTACISIRKKQKNWIKYEKVRLFKRMV